MTYRIEIGNNKSGIIHFYFVRIYPIKKRLTSGIYYLSAFVIKGK